MLRNLQGALMRILNDEERRRKKTEGAEEDHRREQILHAERRQRAYDHE